MKMKWQSFVSGMVVGSVVFSGISYAAPKVVKLMVNGNELQSEVAAQIIDGSTLVPARALAESLGAKVSWDEKNQTVIVENEAYRHQQRKYADLTERDAIGIAADAQRHFWNMSSGGGGDYKDGTFTVPGNEHPYRWMGSDLDTKIKFIEYVELLYTPEQAEAYWKKLTAEGSIVEIEGKLAQPAADGGSALAWGDAKVELLEQGAGTRTYRFVVPLHEEFEQKEVKLRYVQGKGWRIDQPVDTIR
jgi:hypothetical protein